MDPTQQRTCRFSLWFRWAVSLARVLEEKAGGKQAALLDGLGLCGTVEGLGCSPHTPGKLALTHSCHFGCL